jgi:hypothetical protein
MLYISSIIQNLDFLFRVPIRNKELSRLKKLRHIKIKILPECMSVCL